MSLDKISLYPYITIGLLRYSRCCFIYLNIWFLFLYTKRNTKRKRRERRKGKKEMEASKHYFTNNYFQYLSFLDPDSSLPLLVFH